MGQGVRGALGIDAAHREPFGVRYLQNTWRFGLDRVLTGWRCPTTRVAGSELRSRSTTWAAIGSSRLGGSPSSSTGWSTATDRLTGSRSLAEWLEGLDSGVLQLTRVDRADQWQVGQMQRELARVAAEAGDRGTSAVRLTDARALLQDHLAGNPTRANFRSGSLTVCTMVPMRSVPHRVVCLLGLDDGVFPRQIVVDGDDVLARTPVTGERDVRSEDRQLLLDAIGAATERLVVTYTGADAHSGQPRPPAVPLGSSSMPSTEPRRARSARTSSCLTHSSATTSATSSPVGSARRSVSRRPADARRRDRGRPASCSAAPPFLAEPLPAPAARADADRDVALADLVAFFKDPVKGFFRALDLTLPWDVDQVSDAMPVEINQLETWASATGCSTTCFA